MIVHKNGHANQAGGCCCPICGNTCGFHPEYSKPSVPDGYSTLAEYIHEKEKEKEEEEEEKKNSSILR